jgi:hypothetical protein
MDTGYYMTHPDAVDLWVSDKPSTHMGYRERHEVCRTPLGDLYSIRAYSPEHLPGMTLKYPIESVDDARKFLSIPYEPMGDDILKPEDFFARDKALGERGIMIAQIDFEPIYAVQMLMGSELFAVWLLEERDLIRELVECLAERVVDRVQYMLDRGIGPVFGYYGPEVCIPPLARPQDFQEFVVEVDKRFIRLLKEAGCLLWVHCHGKMGPVIKGFMEMGVNCLNPIEPPPMGDLTLREVRSIVENRMCLEGNIEADDLHRAPAEHIRRLVQQAVEEGRGGGFILCPTSGFMEWPFATERLVDNYLTYIEAGLEYGRNV